MSELAFSFAAPQKVWTSAVQFHLMLQMQKGFNSDIIYRSKKVHIQTEDWGQQNPYVVTQIFCNGAVIKTIKTPYDYIFQNGRVKTAETIQQAVRLQHSQVIDLISSGQLLTQI